MSMIQRVRDFVASCPFITDFFPRVDYISGNEEYGVYPTGEEMLSEDMSGYKEIQYNFILQANRFSADDQMRLQNCEFVEKFQRWLDSYDRVGIPLDEGIEFISISAGNGMFSDVSEDGQIGTYQIMCNLIYERMV